MAQLAKGVAVCRRLRYLNLRQNYISDRSAQLLFEALETSPTLRNLNLRTNSIGSDACTRIMQAAAARPGVTVDLRANYPERAFNPDPVRGHVSSPTASSLAEGDR